MKLGLSICRGFRLLRIFWTISFISKIMHQNKQPIAQQPPQDTGVTTATIKGDVMMTAMQEESWKSEYTDYVEPDQTAVVPGQVTVLESDEIYEDIIADQHQVVFESATKRQVLLKDLLAANLLDSTTVKKYDQGNMTSEEVQIMVANLKVYVDGILPIAGIISSTTGEQMSIVDASKVGLIKKVTAYELLEAQAACGKLMDIRSREAVSVEMAISRGIIDRDFEDVVVHASRAVSGYKEPFRRGVLSLSEAMSRRLVMEKDAIRWLETQIATGGIIDMQSPLRISVQVAQKRGLLDERTGERLSKRKTASYYDPMTGENLNYSELMARCVFDKDSNLLFLMAEGGTVTQNIRPFEPEPETMKIREKLQVQLNTEVVDPKSKRPRKVSEKETKPDSPTHPFPSSQAIFNRRVVIVDPNTGDEIGVQEAIKQDLIDSDTARRLLAQEGKWEEEQ